MSRFKYYLAFFHAYMTNMFLLAFIVFFINTHNGKPPSIGLFILITIVVLLAAWCIAHHFKLRYIYFLLPIILITTLILDFHWLSALLISYLSVLRIEYLFDDPENTMVESSLITSFLLLIAVSVFQTETTSQLIATYYILFIAQLLFYFAGRLLYLLLDNGYTITRKTIVFLTLISSFITLGIISSIAYRYGVYVAQYIVYIMLSIIVFLMRPFFGFMETIELEMPDWPEGEATDQQREDQTEMIQQESLSSQLPLDSIITIILIMLAAAGLYFFYKNRQKPTDHPEKPGSIEQHNSTNDIQKEKRSASKAPQNKIRKLYYEFEKWLAVKSMGRYRNETIDEWISRRQLEDIIDTTTLETYRRTRYMSSEVSEDEYKTYRQAIGRMKKEINTHIKKER
ncbi:hypothetical protein ACFOU0_00750 [Salinicoccus sesuvii]|uniref:DUF4129 domain-containing protein n=1 Tax=Salinicoccus sesuvii TaxID=868281 RepID=A0ABV7N0M2_9STAP